MIYIDTNIWLNFINSHREKTLLPKSNIAISLFKKLNSKKVFFSYYNLVKLSAVLRDQILFLRLLGEGCSVFNLRSESKKIELDSREKEWLAHEMALVTSLEFVFPQLEPDLTPISSNDLTELYELIGFNVEMPDAFHIIFAIKNNCKTFITNDNQLYNALSRSKKEFSFLDNLEIYKPKGIVNF